MIAIDYFGYRFTLYGRRLTKKDGCIDEEEEYKAGDKMPPPSMTTRKMMRKWRARARRKRSLLSNWSGSASGLDLHGCNLSGSVVSKYSTAYSYAFERYPSSSPFR